MVIAKHKLKECTASSGERRDLIAVMGDDCSLPVLAKAMMLQNEVMEKERENTSEDLIRSQKIGHRKRAISSHQCPS